MRLRFRPTVGLRQSRRCKDKVEASRLFTNAGRLLRRLCSCQDKVGQDPHTAASPRIATDPGAGVHRSRPARTARHIADAKAPCRRRQAQSTWQSTWFHPLQRVQTRPPGSGSRGHIRRNRRAVRKPHEQLCVDQRQIMNCETFHAKRISGEKSAVAARRAASAWVPRLSAPRTLRSLSGSGSQEWPVRRLGLVCVARQQTVSAPLGQARRPPLVAATALAEPFERRFQKIQPLAHRESAGCLHHCGSEATEPSAPGPVGCADRTAVFRRQGVRSLCPGRSL